MHPTDRAGRAACLPAPIPYDPAMFNLRNFDLNLLVVFEAIHETGSVSRAAERLALSQPAASHALARLRQAFGDALFVRAGQGLAPTAVAEAAYPAVRQALVGLREAMTEARGFMPALSRRRFRLAVPHPLGPFHALALRATMAAEAPGVTVGFDTRSMPEGLAEALRGGTLDLAVDWLPLAQDRFINRKLRDETIVLVARQGHRLAGTTPTVEALRREQFVWLHTRRTSGPRPRAVQQVGEARLDLALEVSEFLEIPAVVSASDLLSLLPAALVRQVGGPFGLAVLPNPLKLADVPVYAIWHESRRHDAGHRWLRDRVATCVRSFE